MLTFQYKTEQSHQHQQPVVVRIKPDADGYQVVMGEKSYRITYCRQEGQMLAFIVDGQHHQVAVAPGLNASDRQLWMGGQTWTLKKIDPRQPRRSSQMHESGALTASMPGQIREILVEVNETVALGAPLIVMEAMKMEMRINAAEGGIVTAINCAVGDVVERGQLLAIVAGVAEER